MSSSSSSLSSISSNSSSSSGDNWTLTVVTTSPSESFKIVLAGTTISIKVIWGDLSSNNYTTAGTKTHTFAAAGTYYVKISGTLTGATGKVIFWTASGNTSDKIIATTAITSVTGIADATYMFYQASSLNNLPNDLFKYCTNISTFFATFADCIALTSIPSDLFEYNVNATSFSFTFYGCTGLTSIPAGLFTYNVNVTTYQSCFNICTNLQGLAPELWNLIPEPTGTDCFYSDVNLSNYGDIPVDWGGGGDENSSSSSLSSLSSLSSASSDSSDSSLSSLSSPSSNSSLSTNLINSTSSLSSPSSNSSSSSGDNWTLTVVTTSPGESFKIVLAGTTINIDVIWGDLSSNNYTTAGTKTHTFAVAGTYYVKISGALTGTTGKVIFWTAIGNTSNKIKATTAITSVTGIAKVDDMFNGAGFTSLPNELFKNCTSIGITNSFSYTFYGCIGLTSLPSDLFEYNTGITTNAFINTFNGCIGLTSLPSDLFEHNTGITTGAFSSTFKNCVGLTSLPSDLFSYSTGITSGAFVSTFESCTGLTSLPSDLFEHNIGIAATSFVCTFYGCIGLTNLPSNLFEYNISSKMFYSTFYGCTGLTSIPAGLFTYNVDVTSYYSCFYGCTGLTSIPAGLFTYNVNVTSYEACFNACTNLEGLAPELWLLMPEPTGTDCFYGDVSLSNYGDIPVDWGGGGDENSSSTSSSSSSSSSYPWNFVKPLTLGHSATSLIAIQNMLAQSIPIYKASMSIKKAYCYLYGPYGTSPFTIYLGVYNCLSDGTPTTLIKEVSISSTIITENGWYEFELDTVSFPVTNGYIAFVMRQVSGDENNYALWGYVNSSNDNLIKSFITCDGSNWVSIDNIYFGIRVIENEFTLFDLTEHQILSAPAESNTIATNLQSLVADSSYNGTILQGSNVIVDNPNLFISFVLDKSGSMGWNDRLSNRTEFVTDFINILSNNYSKNVIYDIIGFGSTQIDQSGFQQTGNVFRINLSARNPTRTSYIFTAEGSANVSSEAIYSHNSFNYTVIQDVSSGIEIKCIGNETPLASGVLTKVSGTGDAAIPFSNFIEATVDNSSFIACGFKNFTNTRTYNVCSIQIDDVDIVMPNSESWQMFYPSSEAPTMLLGANGPSSSASLDIVASSNVVIRNPFYSGPINVANIYSSVTVGDSNVVVSSTNSFSVGDIIDMVDGDFASFGHQITEISNISPIITYTPNAIFDIGNTTQDNGIIQYSSYYNQLAFNGTTIMLLVRDVNTTGEDLTFFLQTIGGLMIEWDFEPTAEWKYGNFYWIGDTATLNFNLKDTNGNQLLDDTRVDIEIDTKNLSTGASNTISYQIMTQISNVGSNIIYIESLEGLERDMTIIITDNNNAQTNVIESLGTDIDGNLYIEVYDVLQFTFNPNDGGKIIIPIVNEMYTSEDLKVSVPLSLVDITPIYENRQLAPSVLQPYDPPQIDPSTTYDELNFKEGYIKNSIQDIPSIGGSAIIRVLPITEDILTTNKEKEKKAERLMKFEPPVHKINQLEQNSNDLSSIYNAPNEPTQIVIGSDYTVETPVYLESGLAESRITSSAISFTEGTIDGICLPVDSSVSTLLFRKYVVYPSVVAKTTSGKNANRQYGKEFDIYYSPRYYIYSSGGE